MPYRQGEQGWLFAVKVFFINIYIYFTALMSYLNIKAEMFIILAVLIFIDYITGVAASFRVGKDITSQKMQVGILSKFIILLIPLSFALTAKMLNVEHYEFLIYSGIDILALSELYSIISNIYTIRTKKFLPEFDVVSLIGAKIQDIIENKLKTQNKKDFNE